MEQRRQCLYNPLRIYLHLAVFEMIAYVYRHRKQATAKEMGAGLDK